MDLADLDPVVSRTVRRCRPPPRLSLSAWANDHFRLSAESAAEPGRWRTLPYQRSILDAITDPAIERVSVMKSARVGYTKMINAAIAFHMAHDPCPILVVQPTIDNAKIYSKEEIAPMLRDVEILAGLVSETSVKSSANTVAHKAFPGGILQMIGANSGRGFRMVSRRVVIFDEVDAYPHSAGDEGDPIKLGEKRSEYYWNRKLIAGSTPLIAGASRIEELFLAGDRRRYYVPCPHCSATDYLVFDEKSGAGHVMRWPENKPEQAHFECRKCGSSIEETHKYAMIGAGEWRAEAEFRGHASFHVWAAYSMSPNATWGKIAAEFVEAKRRPETLRTFVNTVLGETWKERGDAPDWELIYQRRASYAIGTIPVEPLVLTCGVDVQKDRLVFEVVAWLADKQSYSVDAGALLGDTALDSTWNQLDELLNRTFPGPDGIEHHIRMLAIDSGYNTQTVYGWARRHPLSRVIACKGSSTANVLVGTASPVDITLGGRKIQRGYRVYTVGVDLAKSEIYGWLRLRRGDGDAPAGYCHFPEYEGEFFKQLTAEHLVTVPNRKTGREVRAWHVLPNRENHYLDCRILARAAAYVLKLDTYKPVAPAPSHSEPAPTPSRSFMQPRNSIWNGRGPRRWFK